MNKDDVVGDKKRRNDSLLAPRRINLACAPAIAIGPCMRSHDRATRLNALQFEFCLRAVGGEMSLFLAHVHCPLKLKVCKTLERCSLRNTDANTSTRWCRSWNSTR